MYFFEFVTIFKPLKKRL